METQNEQKRSALLLPLIAVTALFLLGVLFFVIEQDRKASTVVPEVNRGGNITSETVTMQDLVELDRAITQYSQMLPEAARESADGDSVEAAGAQEALREQTTLVAQLLSGRVLTKEREPVPTERIANALDKFNASILEYAVGARAGMIDESNVNTSVEELNQVLNSKSGQDKARIEDAIVSFKNSVTSSIRDFTEERYASSYQNQLKAQDTARELFKLVQD